MLFSKSISLPLTFNEGKLAEFYARAYPIVRDAFVPVIISPWRFNHVPG